MKERPILFSGAMVRAILDGSKTQTRRVVKSEIALDWLEGAKFTPEFVASPENNMCKFGKIGDRLWVRETFYPVYPQDPDYNDGEPIEYDYRATYDFGRMSDALGIKKQWRPSIHMPRRASRITLEITNIRVERLQDIRAEDAYEEGVDIGEFGTVYEFKKLWESINGAESWELNPWVWVIEFRRV